MVPWKSNNLDTMLIIFSMFTAPSWAAPPSIHACWMPIEESTPTLDLRSDGTFTSQGKTGRFMSKGSETWLLVDGEPRMGTKWLVALGEVGMVLSKPEDFKFLGAGEYLYLQLTPPDTVWGFKAATADELTACKAAAKAPGPKEETPSKK